MVTLPRARRSPTRARRGARLLVVLAAGVLAACGGSAATPPEDGAPRRSSLGADDLPASAPAIRGTVTQIVAGDSVASTVHTQDPSTPVSCPPSCGATGPRLRSVLVEEIPGGGGDKSVITMLASARVLRRTPSGVEPAGFADLRVGQQVAAWFDGPVAESYPSQARGGVVVIDP